MKIRFSPRHNNSMVVHFTNTTQVGGRSLFADLALHLTLPYSMLTMEIGDAALWSPYEMSGIKKRRLHFTRLSASVLQVIVPQPPHYGVIEIVGCPN